jgi:glycosyltransferase involved in cell wall biosynthesis
LLKLRRLHGLPLVFEVHGLPSVELLHQIHPSREVEREAARRRQLEQAVFKDAWRLIAITDCLRQRLIRDYDVPPDRICTVPDASMVGQTPPRAEVSEWGDLKSRCQRERSQPTLAYAGQLYSHKGVDLLLHALVDVPRARLLIIGGLPDDPQRERLENLSSELGVAERVLFSGPQPYEKVPALLAEADIALLPLADGVVARCFTSPLKLFDYLAAGLPIVAVDFPTIREVLRDGENGLLVPPNDPSAFAAAINRLIDDPDLARRLGRQARQDASGYTWDRRAERLLAALEIRTTNANRGETAVIPHQPSR